MNNTTLDTSTIITFKDPIEKALFDEELTGQISDGMWENTRNTEWLWAAKTQLGDSNAISFHSYHGKTGFRFASLIEHVGDRMIEVGKRFDPDYNEKKLRKNLRNISKIIKMARD
jgi:hypothetical protein